MNEKIEAIRVWLAERIGNATIAVHETPDGPQFVIHRGDLDWSVLFTEDFLNSVGVDDIRARLDQLHLIEELTAVEDLPLVVEPSGIRLLSNN